MLESQEKACRQAERLQREKDETHMSNANPNPTEYPIGSWVLAEYHSSIIRKGPPSKLNTQLRGPYKVLKRELDAYTIRNTVTRKDEEIHGTFLRPFLFDSNFIDPRDVAMKDAISTFVVEAIIEHEGDRKRLSTLFFKTRWLGYDEAFAKGGELAKRNMVKVVIKDGTIPHEIFCSFDGAKIILRPASPGTGIIAGKKVRAILESAGIKDILTKSLGSSNAANVVRATLNGLLKLRLAEDIYAARGLKYEKKTPAVVVPATTVTA